MNLHKLLFPKKQEEIDLYRYSTSTLRKIRYEVLHVPEGADIVEYLKGYIQQKHSPKEMENLMRASLGLPYIRFDNIEEDAKGNDNPPHYLKGLDEKARLAYIAELAQIFRNEKFQAVMNYHINVLGNHAIQKASDDNMRNGRIGIIALRGFRKELEDANKEYLGSLKEEEKFDEHAIMAE